MGVSPLATKDMARFKDRVASGLLATTLTFCQQILMAIREPYLIEQIPTI